MSSTRIFIYGLLLSAIPMLAACQATSPPQAATIQPKPSPSATINSSPTAGRVDPTSVPTVTPIPYRLQPGELLLAANPDDIPALEVGRSDFVSASTGNDEWELAELVVGLEIEGEARAYPVRLLSLHEIVNDEIAGIPVAVTWCPLCYTAITFDRRVDGQSLTFGVSGYLFNSNLVMFDRQTDTLWSQLLGQGIRGAYRNEWLKILPSQLASWGDWQERHPETLVLSAVELGMETQELVDPYVGYYSSGIAGLSGDGSQDKRLPGKALVVGVRFQDQAKAYVGNDLREMVILNDEIGRLPLVLVYDSQLESILVFDRRIAGEELVFELDGSEDLFRDQQTGSQWRRSDGVAVQGPLQGQRLQQLQSTVAFWFAWSEFEPDTELYQVENEE